VVQREWVWAVKEQVEASETPVVVSTLMPRLGHSNQHLDIYPTELLQAVQPVQQY
jgi:hypothetical protein